MSWCSPLHRVFVGRLVLSPGAGIGSVFLGEDESIQVESPGACIPVDPEMLVACARTKTSLDIDFVRNERVLRWRAFFSASQVEALMVMLDEAKSAPFDHRRRKKRPPVPRGDVLTPADLLRKFSALYVQQTEGEP